MKKVNGFLVMFKFKKYNWEHMLYADEEDIIFSFKTKPDVDKIVSDMYNVTNTYFSEDDIYATKRELLKVIKNYGGERVCIPDKIIYDSHIMTVEKM